MVAHLRPGSLAQGLEVRRDQVKVRAELRAEVCCLLPELGAREIEGIGKLDQNVE
jgi:hypothetical protein